MCAGEPPGYVESSLIQLAHTMGNTCTHATIAPRQGHIAYQTKRGTMYYDTTTKEVTHLPPAFYLWRRIGDECWEHTVHHWLVLAKQQCPLYTFNGKTVEEGNKELDDAAAMYWKKYDMQ